MNRDDNRYEPYERYDGEVDLSSKGAHFNNWTGLMYYDNCPSCTAFGSDHCVGHPLADPDEEVVCE